MLGSIAEAESDWICGTQKRVYPAMIAYELPVKSRDKPAPMSEYTRDQKMADYRVKCVQGGFQSSNIAFFPEFCTLENPQE